MNTKVKEILLNILIFLGAIVLLLVVGYPQYKESQPTKIRIGVDNSYGSLPFYVAKMDTSRRYFTIEKVEPEFVPISGDPLQGINNNQYDIVAVPWYRLLLSPAVNGDTVRAIGSLEMRSGKSFDAILLPADSKIKRIRDLKGKRLGYVNSDEYIVNLILAQMQEEMITDIEKVPLAINEIETAFTDNKVDALYLLDPYRGYMTFMKSVVLMDGLVSNYIMSSMPIAAIVIREDFVMGENKLGAIRIKNAVEATLGYMMRNPDVARRLIIKIHNWPAEGQLVHHIRLPEFQRLAEVNLRNVEVFQTELVRRGIGTCGIKPSEFLYNKLDFVR